MRSRFRELARQGITGARHGSVTDRVSLRAEKEGFHPASKPSPLPLASMKSPTVRRNITSVPPSERPNDPDWFNKVPKADPASTPSRKKRFRRVDVVDWEGPPDGREGKKSTQRKSSPHRRAKKRGIYPIALGVCLVLIGFLLARVSWSSDRPVQVPSKPSKFAMVAAPLESTPTGPTRPSQQEALSIVAKALAVRDPSAVDKWIFPGAVPPEQVAEFMAKSEERDGPAGKVIWTGPADANGLPMESVAIYFGKGAHSTRLAFLTPTPEGKWKMDFEAFARRTEPSWEEIMGAHDAPAIVRVFVGPDTYFNEFFHSEKEWRCIGMVSPDFNQLLYGYCRKGTRQEEGMRKLIHGADDRTVRATLEIRRHDGPGARQFEILSVIAEDWVARGVPFDQR